MRISLLALIILSACSSPSPRGPASLSLLKMSEDVLHDVQGPSFPSICVGYLSQLEKTIDELDMRTFSKAELERDALAIAEHSWKIRSVLHERLQEFDRPCALQVQSNFRQLRFIEDYFLELGHKVTHLTPDKIDFQKQPIPMKEARPFYVFRGSAPNFDAGDMLVTRGVSFLSGMIARLGKRGTQFSHIVFVHKDAKGAMKTIESYVGTGVAFYEMDFALKNENARILWLRNKNPVLAHAASVGIGTLVNERNRLGRPIKYDYELDFKDHTKMSCAEVSQVAFELADKNFKIPFYPNEIAGSRSLVDRLHIAQGPTYEPGDMEIDPRFELMGEFQDLRLTRDSRQKDAIMTMLFRWMNENRYELHDSMKSRMAGGIIYDARRTRLWPLVKRLLKLDEFSAEVPRNMLSTVTLINQISEAILVELKKKDSAFEKKYGVPMTYMDFYRELEALRKKDLGLYQNFQTRKQSIFHKYFRPKK